MAARFGGLRISSVWRDSWFRCPCGSGTTRRIRAISSSSELPWIPSIGAQYFLGVDGFSTLLVLLATLFGSIAILSSWTAITERLKEYYIFLLILQTGMIGAFRESRFPPVLPVLGSDARSDVLPHRHLGQRPQAVFGDQVLPLHPGRQRRDAAGNPRHSTFTATA